MSADQEPFYWMENPEWYRSNSEGKIELTDVAPERAKKSFEMWKAPRSAKKNPFI